MAKAKTIQDAMIDLKKDYQKVLKSAMQYATEKAKKEIYKKSLTCLEEYYDYDPNSYKRTDSLRKAFLPYSRVLDAGSHIVGIAGVQYAPWILDLEVNYTGSDKYVQPEGYWIISNYLDGIHPITNGETVPDKVIYTPVIDPVSPSEKMEKHIQKCADKFADNVYSYMASYVAGLTL